MQRYRPIFHCNQCGTRWKGAVVRLADDLDPDTDAAARHANGSVQCPNLDCGVVQIDRGIDLSIPKAPAVVGASVQTKAFDATAEMVMQDYGLTDLKSNIHEGETSAPRLPAIQQAQVDNFFVGRGRRNSALAQRTAAIGQAAIRGAFRQPSGHQTVESLHSMSPEMREVIRPKVITVAGDGVRPPR